MGFRSGVEDCGFISINKAAPEEGEYWPRHSVRKGGILS